ncbi:Ubinuclein conserved middle domain-containing protein [Rhizophagus diaphanus]|nr:Ubinuclein conserved middle domain-containing protein [Rhizophagus diaphanus] [Rhizophagus sp. MUCL 43196]
MGEQPDPIAGAVKLGFTSESPQQTPKRPDIHLDIQLKDKENNVVYFPDLCEAAGFTVIKTPPRYLSGSESVGSETPHSDWSDNDTPNDFSSPRPSSSGDPLPPPAHEESNEFFKRLLENAEKYAQEAQEEKAKEAKEKPEKNPKKRKEKVSKKEQNYDVSDPFIDDSDLAPFQRDYGNIRPTVEGFFVWKGPLTLQGMVDETETGKKRTKRKPKSGDAKDKPPQPRKKRTVKPKEGEEGSDKINKPKRAYKRSKLAVETKLQDSAQTTLPHFINTNLFQPPVINVTPTPQDFATAFNNAFPPNSPDRLLTTNPTEAPKTPTFNIKVIPDPNKTPGKKKKIYPIEPIRPEIQVLVDAFKVKVDSETFEIKSRFPPNLKPPLMEILTAAYERSQFNENLFKILTNILPYNKFTVTRLCQRTLYPKTISELHKTKADLIERLKAAVEEVMPLLIQEYNERQATRALLDSTSATSNSESMMDIDGETEQYQDPNGKKFRWDETTRSLLWKIVQAEMSIVVMSNDLWEAEEKSERYSEQTQRKHLYQNLLTVWPSGWMTSYEIARVYSAYKRYLRDRQTTS